MGAVAALVAVTGALGGCGGETVAPMMDGRQAGERPYGPMAGPGRSAACSAPASMPGSTVHVVLGDMGMQMMGSAGHLMLHAVPVAVPAGKVSFEVTNVGRRTHELVVLPLAAGQAAGQRVPGADGRVDESGSLGEASASCAEGAGEGITAGSTGWVTLTLAPGSYELVCNLPNHYARGMYQAITVS